MPFTSENRHARQTLYLDAPVSMPITSSHLWNAQGFRTTLDEDFGETLHKESGQTDPLIVRNGVYFLKMRVSKHLLPPDAKGHLDVREACAA